ncbi:MAG: hypothetical protein IT165_22435 [Bryobacterales bacterium]|nr:hypothetical protein [Bryobacterales bacterium]
MNTGIRRAYISGIKRVTALLAALALCAAALAAGGPGFRSKRQFEEHYAKHGAEFGHISKQEYLRLAQEFRDAPKGGAILEAVRADGVITRFDRKNGWFGAFNPDRTIRTFFIPADGERYFRRQARRPAK